MSGRSIITGMRIDRLRNWQVLTALMLVVALAGWRLLLAEHMYEHDAGSEVACELCAHAQANGACLPSAALPPVLLAPTAAIAAPPATRSAAALAGGYRARAPPLRLV